MTKEDVQQIGELLEPINKRLDGIEKNMVTKSDLEANNRVLGTIIKVELAESNKRIDAIVAVMNTGFQETTKQIKRVEQKLDETAEDHEERMKRLEDYTDIHKN